MEILGIGMPELIFIVVIALIVLGPKDMQKAGKTIGKWMRDLVTSDGWKIFQQTSREIRTLPTKLMREANEELNKIGDEISGSDSARPRYGSWDTNSQRFTPPPAAAPTSTTPPVVKDEPAPASADSQSPEDNSEANA
jgi:sec-independent protein translocase protein TatB